MGLADGVYAQGSMTIENIAHRILDKSTLQNAYALRAHVRFIEENDHNPTILRDCPRCGGRVLCEQYADHAFDKQCSAFVLYCLSCS